MGKLPDDLSVFDGAGICQKCNGRGWYSDHAIGPYDHDGEGNCLGNCPVQVQCECGGIAITTSILLAEVKKLRSWKATLTKALQAFPVENVEGAQEQLNVFGAAELALMQTLAQAEREFENG